MQALIEQELLRTPDIANNWLAEMLGVDDRTVLAARKRLESTSALRKFTKLRGKDGKSRAASYGRIVANTPAELRIAQKVAKNLPPSCNGKMIDAVSASRHARRFARAEVRDGQPVRQLAMDSIQIHHCPFQKLEKVAGHSSRQRSIGGDRYSLRQGISSAVIGPCGICRAGLGHGRSFPHL